MEVCGNVDQACRLCLHGEGRISVFEQENTKLSVTSESIYKCVSVKITKEDRLPKSICENCLSNVKNWCSFKNTCDRTQETLNGWLTCDRLNADFKEEEISIVKDSLPNSSAASFFDDGNDNSLLPAPSAFLGNNVVETGTGTVPCQRVEEMPPDVERSSSEDEPVEISSTLLNEEENRQSSVVSSTKEEIEDTSLSGGSSEQDGIHCSPANHCSQIENVESQQVSEKLTAESEVTLSNELQDSVQNGGVLNSVEPMEVSSNVEDETNFLAPEKLPFSNLDESSSIFHSSVEVADENSVHSSQLVNVKEISQNVISDETKNNSVSVVNSLNDLESIKELETGTSLDVRLIDTSQSVEHVSNDNVSCEFIDSTNTSKDNLNLVVCNKLKEDGDLPDTTIMPSSKAVEGPKNESSPDSDKENYTPNSATLSPENSKDKQAKILESGEHSGEVENHSFSDIRIESISTLTIEGSDFFNTQDGKTNSDPSTTSGIAEKPTGSGVNESSSSLPADKSESCEVSTNLEEHQKEKEVSVEEERNNALGAEQDTVMEVDRAEGVTVEEQPERAILVESGQETPPFSELMVQNIKQEPIDTHDMATSGDISSLYPIRVKSEFTSFEYDDDVTNDYLECQPSVSGEEINKCDICNRKYSSLSNYLKHLQTKVHIYNASLCPRDNNMQIPDSARTAKYLGDSGLNYSIDSYSEDSRLSTYSNDSPMLRSRLCSEEFVQPSPSKVQHFIARQAQPRVPYASSLSKLPKRKERCKLCNTSFTYISEMRRHLLSKKHKDNERMMRDNDRMMRENQRLIRDSERMFREKERFMRERALMSPKKEEVPTPQPEKNQLPYICPIEDCHYSCQKGIRLLAHMRTHGIGQPSAPPTQNVVKEVDSSMAKPKLSLRQQELLKKELEKRRASTVGDSISSQPIVHDFKCDGCSKTFLRESGLKKHTYYCSAIIAEQQEEEQPKFPDNNIDNLQIKKMHCPICNLTFAAKSVFVSHVQIYHKGSTLESGLFRPKKTIITSNKLRIKSKKGHSYVCNHCGKKFNLLSSLNFHLKVHSTKHICRICKKGYDSRRAFMDHCRLHFLPPGSKQTLCHKCFRVFKTRGDFYFHRKNDMCSIKLKIYTCNICQHSFKDPSALNEHKTKFHTDILDVSEDEETPSADRGASSQNYLSINRQNLETANENRPGTSSKLHSNINHSTIQSNSDPILHCDVCDRDYATIASLKKHMWKYHQTRPMVVTRRIEARRNNVLQANISKCWKCKHCKKVFATRRMLVVHLKKCKYNALEPEAGMCLQCGKWCESGKSRICRFCLPDLSKIPKAKRSLPESNFLMTPKPEFSMAPKQEFNSAPARVSNHNLQVPKAKTRKGGGIRLMKCPVGNKYFRSELLMIKHYSQCDGSCENRCSHCRKLFNSSKEYKTHLLNSNCYGSNRLRTKVDSNLSLTPIGDYPEPQFQESDMHSVKNNDELDTSGEMSVVDSSISEDNSIMDLDTGLENDPSNKIIEEKSIKIGRVCTICNKVITMQRGVYRHVYACFKQCMLSQESVSCKKCSRTFSKHLTMKENTSAIRQHILDCHYIPYYEGEGIMEDGSRSLGTPPLLCYVCSFGFSSNESLKRHITEHRTRKDEINNVVLLLEAEILSERRMNSESVSYHIEIQPEICETVSSQPVRKRNVLSFKAPGSLGMGSRKIIRKKLLECEKCNRKFTNRNKFLRHKKVHGIVTQSVFHEVSENYLNFITDHTPPSSN